MNLTLRRRPRPYVEPSTPAEYAQQVVRERDEAIRDRDAALADHVHVIGCLLKMKTQLDLVTTERDTNARACDEALLQRDEANEVAQQAVGVVRDFDRDPWTGKRLVEEFVTALDNREPGKPVPAWTSTFVEQQLAAAKQRIEATRVLLERVLAQPKETYSGCAVALDAIAVLDGEPATTEPQL